MGNLEIYGVAAITLAQHFQKQLLPPNAYNGQLLLNEWYEFKGHWKGRETEFIKLTLANASGLFRKLPKVAYTTMEIVYLLQTSLAPKFLGSLLDPKKIF